MFTRSVILVFLITERSRFLKPGPIMLFRPMFPNVFVIGVKKIPAYELWLAGVLVGAIHGLSGFPVTTIGPMTVGVTVLPTPVIALDVRTMFTGLPLCSVPIEATD